MSDGRPILMPIVAGVVLRRDGKYLLVQEKQPKAHGLWNWPAGKVDEGFTIEQTAVKEAKEESGFDVVLVRKIGIWQEAATEPPKHLFTAEITGGVLKFPPDEIMDAKWFTQQEIIAMKDKLRRSSFILEPIEILEQHS